MTRTVKISIGIGLAALLVAGPFMLIVLGNAGAGLLSAILDKRPTEGELVRSYAYFGEWGNATLALHKDHTFEETLVTKENAHKQVRGTWTSYGKENYLDVIFRPFLSVQDEDHGQRFEVAGLPAFKQRFGSVYVLINDDIGERFTTVK